jgi:hypothetical protein
MARIGISRRLRSPVLLLAAFVSTATLAGCGGGSPAATKASMTSAPTTTRPTSVPNTAPTTTAAPTTTPATTTMPTTTTAATTTTTTAGPTTTLGGHDNRVFVLGDSVLLGTEQTLPAALVGWQVTMDCVGSRRLPQGIEELQANRSRIGAVVVIQMGNNYIAGEDGTFASQIDQAMRVLAGVKLVVWVTVAEEWPSRVMINEAIRASASRWPNIRIADWAPIIAAHPDYAFPPDMLHLSWAGRAAMAQLIASVVGRAPK